MHNNYYNKNCCVEVELNTPEIEIDLEMGAKGEKGDTYNLTEQDKEDISSMTVESSESAFNQYYNDKLKDFNSNATSKTNDFDTNTETKTAQFNSNYTSKVQSFNENSTSKTNDYNTNATNKTIEFNTNADTKLQEYNTNANNKIAEYDEHSQELDNKIIDTRNELERVKNDVLETGTDTDTFIHVEDSAMAEMQELSVDGVCEQKTTSGIQLFKDIPTQTKVGVTLTNNGDGSYTLNGTSTSKTSFYVLVNYSSGTYSLSLNNDIKLPANCYTQIETSNGNKRVTFTNDNKKTFECGNINALSIVIANDITLNNFKFAPMLELGTEYHNVEKYTGGLPSPSPDYPQEIKTIENSLKITSCNKNLFDFEDFKSKLAPTYAVEGNTNEFTIEGYGKVEYLINKFPLSVSGLWSTTGLNGHIYLLYADGTKGLLFSSYSKDEASGNINITATKEIKSLVIEFYNKSKVNISNFQIKNDIKITSFEQHLESQIEANLPEGEFIGKIDDIYKDKLKVEYNEEDGQYHLVLNKMIRHFKLPIADMNNIENYPGWKGQIVELLDTDFPLRNSYLSEYTNYISNITNYKNTYKINTNSAVVPVLYFNSASIFDSYMTQTEVKEKYPNLMVDLYYGMSKDNQYTVDLGVVDIPLSYDEITNIFTDSDLLPQINAKYYKNFVSTIKDLQINNNTLKNELASIESRLTALESASTISDEK